MRPKLMDWEGEGVPKNDEIWMPAGIKKSLKNKWFGMPKLQKIVKKTVRKITYFSHAIFNRFWRGLGRVLGGVWEGFGEGLGRFGWILRGLGPLWALLGLSARFCAYFPAFYTF